MRIGGSQPRRAAERTRAETQQQQGTVGGASVDVTGGQLTVRGTHANDKIRLDKLEGGGVRLTVNGESKDFAGVLGAKLLGKGGDDRITVGPGLLIPVTARGGAGHDTIHGSDAFDKSSGKPHPTNKPSLPGLPGTADAPPLDYDAILGDG